jgi:anaerobic dimethyl sulfoxide reductase subunit C (anchor subunit)
MDIQWPLVFFTLFVGLGCGTFVGTVILTEWCGKEKQIRMASLIVALVALGVGGISSTMHLGHLERMFGALGHPTSGIFMESTMIGLVGFDIIVYLLAIRRNAGDQTCKVIGTVGALLAVVLAFANGHAYVMAARPAWNTLILPVLYVASAGVMGCFTLSVLLARTTNANQAVAGMIKRWTLAALGIEAVLLIAYLVYLAVAPYPNETRSVARVLAGNLAPLFWGGLVLLGLLVPAALLTKFYANKSFKLGLVCVLAAGAALRMLMFLLGSGIRNFFEN